MSNSEHTPVHREPSSRDKALALVSKIEDMDIRRYAESSLGSHASIYQMVKAFHKVYDLPIVSPSQSKDNFAHMTKERLAMRFGLIVEEFKELCEAMDMQCRVQLGYLDEEEETVWTEDVVEAITNTEERCVADVADALFDLKYVIVGFEYEVGIDPQTCALEGQASNLSKLMPDGSVLRREDGKVLKGPDFFRPDMAKALKAWGMKDV